MKEKEKLKKVNEVYQIMKKGKPKFLLNIILSIIEGTILILYVAALSQLINALSKWNKSQIVFWLGMIIVIRLIQLLNGKLLRFKEKELWSKNVITLKEAFLNRLGGCTTDIVEKYMNSDLLTRFSDDLEAIVMLFNNVFIKIIVNILVIIGIMIFVGNVDWRMNIIALVLFPGILYIVLKKGKDVENFSGQVQRKKSILNGQLKDIIEHSIEIQSYGAEEFFIDKSFDSIKSTLKDELKLFFHERVAWASEIIFYELFHLAYFVSGACIAYLGKTKVGFVVSVMMLNGYLVEQLFNLPNLYISYRKTLPKIERYLEILKEESYLKQINNTKDTNKNLVVNIEHLKFRYENTDVIKDISIKIKNGEKVAIIGRSGSGKSTLLKLMAGYSYNYQGSISILGASINKENIQSIYSRMSYMPQDVYLINKSIEENLAIFSSVSDEQCIKKFIPYSELVGINKEIEHFQNGYQTEVESGMNNLSKGQVQRIGWMICLMKNAPLMLIDEGFSSIDSERIQKIFNQIINDKSKTVIMATHVLNESMLKQFDRIYLIEDGKIVLQGPHELLKCEDKYRSFYNVKRRESVYD